MHDNYQLVQKPCGLMEVSAQGRKLLKFMLLFISCDSNANGWYNQCSIKWFHSTGILEMYKHHLDISLPIIKGHLREFVIRNCTVWYIFILRNVFFALKGSNFFILIFLITSLGVVPCGGPQKSSVHHPKCRLYFTFSNDILRIQKLYRFRSMI